MALLVNTDKEQLYSKHLLFLIALRLQSDSVNLASTGAGYLC